MTTAAAAPKHSTDFLDRPHRLLIDGRFVDAVDGRTFDTIDPGTGRVLATVAEGSERDIDRAVEAARRAAEGPWSKMSPSDRGRIVHRIGDLIAEHAEELAELESLDSGKPASAALAVELPLAADMFWYMSGAARRINGTTVTPSVPYMPGGEFHAYTTREPLGVAGQIIPWNVPILMAAWKLAPALATGNTVVLKPAEQTPLTALRIGELLLEAGLPDGVVNIVPGFGERAGAHLAAHDGVDKIAFTGSTEVGRSIVRAAAGNLKRVSLELGGKSPNIVLDDADVDAAIAGAALAIFYNQGEVCSAGSRLYVHESQFDRVVEGLAEHARGIRVGYGLDPDTEMGPLVSAEHFERVGRYLDLSKGSGGQTLAGGSVFDGDGYYVQPSVIARARPGPSDRPRGDLRAGGHRYCRSVTSTISRGKPTTRSTDSPRVCGPPICRRHTGLRSDSRPEPCTSTRTTCSLPSFLSAATSRAAGAGRRGTLCSSSIWKPNPSSSRSEPTSTRN